MTEKPTQPIRQLIRDPLHNIITFNVKDNVEDNLERNLWKILQTEPMQRLRRIRQLGFAEYVYPGATHSRFAHSVGVMHIARRMITLISSKNTNIPSTIREEKEKEVAICAALLHDIGHGPFSHAFEEALKENGKKTFDHEEMTKKILLDKKQSLNKKLCNFIGQSADTEISEILKNYDSTYSSFINSQFDADRLDYMQRDALMTGTKHGAIDFEWLINNLEIGELNVPIDEGESSHKNETKHNVLMLNKKGVHAAETYLLGLLQLYQTVYFHKTVRGAETLFTKLLKEIITIIKENPNENTNYRKTNRFTKIAPFD